jgi:hypothetical protein
MHVNSDRSRVREIVAYHHPNQQAITARYLFEPLGGLLIVPLLKKGSILGSDLPLRYGEDQLRLVGVPRRRRLSTIRGLPPTM